MFPGVHTITAGGGLLVFFFFVFVPTDDKVAAAAATAVVTVVAVVVVVPAVVVTTELFVEAEEWELTRRGWLVAPTRRLFGIGSLDDSGGCFLLESDADAEGAEAPSMHVAVDFRFCPSPLRFDANNGVGRVVVFV